ncbi:hypothetical protein WBG78_15235 [Chryseolinea sp. T2]|uniref:hypothetical protein n=1 Tax=Chryseolinea sp. T2 TaxID=3129255 RepID=UPI0030775FEF
MQATKRILYTLAVLLLTMWLIAVIIYSLTAVVHLLALSAVLLVVLIARLDKKLDKKTTV